MKIIILIMFSILLSYNTLALDNNMFANNINHDNYYNYSYPNKLSNIHATFFTGYSMDILPIIWNGNAYFLSTNGNLYQNNASNISEVINIFVTDSANNRLDEKSMPMIVNETLYVGSTNGYVYKLNASNITQELGKYNSGGAIQSSPIIINNILYIGTSKTNQLLQINISDMTLMNNISTNYYNFASPSCDEQQCYFTSYDGGIYQVNQTNFTLTNTYHTNRGFTSSPSYNEKYVYAVNDNGKAYQWNRSNVSELVNIYVFGGDSNETSSLVSHYKEHVYFGSGSWISGTFDDSKIYQNDKDNISININTLDVVGSMYNGVSFGNNDLALFTVTKGTYENNISETMIGTAYLVNASNISNIIDIFKFARSVANRLWSGGSSWV